MAHVTPSIMTPVVRNNYFSETLSVSGTNVVGVTCTSVGTKDSGVSISTSLSNVVISGRYLDVSFEDVTKYVEKGSSDILETPKTVVGINNVPKGKDLYEFNQDLKDDILRQYTVTVSEELVPTVITTETFTVSQYIKNNWTFGKDFLDEYFGNAT